MLYLYRFVSHHLQQTELGRAILRFVVRHRRRLDTIESFAIAILLAIVIVTLVAEAFQIPSGSMNDTLLEGDRIFVNKFLYRLGLLSIHRGDIIVFRTRHIPKIVQREKETGEKQPYYIKRVVALPGDEVHIAHGRIHINGKPLETPWVFANNTYYAHNWYTVHLQYWPGPSARWPGGGGIGGRDDTHRLGRVLLDDNLSPVGNLVYENISVPEKVLPVSLSGKIQHTLKRLFFRPRTWNQRLPVSVVAADGSGRQLYSFEWCIIREGGGRGTPTVHLSRILDASGEPFYELVYSVRPGGQLDTYVRNADRLRVVGMLGPLDYAQHFRVPAGHVMAMGDNSLSSSDGRDWGPVPINDIVGRAFFRFWPLHRIGFIPDRPTPEGRLFRKYLADADEAAIGLLPPKPWPAPGVRPATP